MSHVLHLILLKMDYKTSKLYKQNEKVILFIQPSYGNSNRIKFV